MEALVVSAATYMKIRQALSEWFGSRSTPTTKREELRLSCYGCLSDQIEMVLPRSPEVFSYRCRKCGREWSSRAPVRPADAGPD